MKKYGKNAFTVIEVMVGVSIITVAFFSLISVFNTAFYSADNSAKNIQASLLLEEGVEALKLLSNSNWPGSIASLQIGGKYYLEFSNGNWQAAAAPNLIDGIFERSFVLENVYRNGADKISQSGTLDPGTKKAIVSVSWQNRTGVMIKSMAGYLFNEN